MCSSKGHVFMFFFIKFAALFYFASILLWRYCWSQRHEIKRPINDNSFGRQASPEKKSAELGMNARSFCDKQLTVLSSIMQSLFFAYPANVGETEASKPAGHVTIKRRDQQSPVF